MGEDFAHTPFISRIGREFRGSSNLDQLESELTDLQKAKEHIDHLRALLAKKKKGIENSLSNVKQESSKSEQYEEFKEFLGLRERMKRIPYSQREVCLRDFLKYFLSEDDNCEVDIAVVDLIDRFGYFLVKKTVERFCPYKEDPVQSGDGMEKYQGTSRWKEREAAIQRRRNGPVEEYYPGSDDGYLKEVDSLSRERNEYGLSTGSCDCMKFISNFISGTIKDALDTGESVFNDDVLGYIGSVLKTLTCTHTQTKEDKDFPFRLCKLLADFDGGSMKDDEVVLSLIDSVTSLVEEEVDFSDSSRKGFVVPDGYKEVTWKKESDQGKAELALFDKMNKGSASAYRLWKGTLPSDAMSSLAEQGSSTEGSENENEEDLVSARKNTKYLTLAVKKDTSNEGDEIGPFTKDVAKNGADQDSEGPQDTEEDSNEIPDEDESSEDDTFDEDEDDDRDINSNFQESNETAVDSSEGKLVESVIERK